MAEHVPPGRAGRLWLSGRLAAARRGAELLDRKRQLLRREREHLALLRGDTQRAWDTACVEAERWGLRSGVLGGVTDTALAVASCAGHAEVHVRWGNTMGVRHPDDARVTAAAPGPAALAAGNAALAPAAAAYRGALAAAVAHAVADDAYGRIDAELQATQRRLRAIERLRVPRLQEALDHLELRLDELEREERVATRWAQRRRGASPTAGGGPGSDDGGTVR
ncbi:MAG TPA: V-type ATP synthase subunit D [Acidimicrobiales bacterium]|nr:V-type ATP synthase subunit D [Acidimicrobiales bacterium]